MIALGLASLSLVVWLYLLLVRGDFWRVWKLQESAGRKPREHSKVVAIIPARDEADVIVAAVGSLASQVFSGDLRVIVVDDNSSDGTADLARDAGATVIPGTPLKEGWTGKLWALQQGVAAATPMEANFYLFTDADIRHDPQNVAEMVGMAQSRNLDLVSHMVKLHCESWEEKLTIPAFVFFFFKLYPPRWIASSTSKVAGAAGGCILIRPETLEAMGGLAVIRNQVIDDCSLARAVKWRGGRVWLGLSARADSIRPYRGLGEIEAMIARSAFRQLNHSTLLLIGASLGMVVTYLVPVVIGLSRYSPPDARYLALAAWAAMTIGYLPMIWFYGLSPLWALSLPAAACFYLYAMVDSAVRYWTGRGGEWKGRAQDQRGSTAAKT